MADTILIVENDEILAGKIRTRLEQSGRDVHVATSVAQALELIGSHRPDVVLADQDLVGKSVADLAVRATEIEPGTKMIIVGADGNRHCAPGAMADLTCDYLSKPLVLAELERVVERALEVRRTEKTLSFYRARAARDGGLSAMIGESVPMQTMKSTICRLLEAEARTPAGDLPVVLIEGETGTGKELVARALHFDGSRRAGPFVEVDCASIPSRLLESELFGHEKGASGDGREWQAGLVEAADGGTLFLNEIGAIDLALQAKLLTLLDKHRICRIGSVKQIEVNPRIIGATNRDIERMVRQGKFCRELFARLRAHAIEVPPLRERGDDILALAQHFLALHGRRHGKEGLHFSAEAEAILRVYGWPGNVRELRNLLDQTVLLAPGGRITPNQLAICPGLAGDCDRDFHSIDSYCMSIPRGGVSVPEVERDLVLKMLDKTDWNVTKSARLLGLSRDMLRYRIEKLGLERPRR